MRLVYNYDLNFSDKNESVVALGTFDGIHIGHRDLISQLHSLKAQYGYNTTVFTFLTHPLRVLAPEKAPLQLMLPGEKIHGFSELGIDTLVMNPFNEDILKQSPQEFLEWLIRQMNIKAIVVGFNYTFGYKGTGNTAFLEDASEKYGFRLISVPPVMKDDRIISSTLIRSLISEGFVEEASGMLTKPYRISGRIVHGWGRGRGLGFPTTNISFSGHKTIPKPGVYLTSCDIEGHIFWGLTSVGSNPTFTQEPLINIETYILNFRGNIYGKKLGVSFLRRIRDEIKFDSAKELTEQMNLDVKNAKNMIYNYRRLC